MEFRVDTAALLNEIFDNAVPLSMGVLKIPINVFRNLLVQVAARAIEIDDPELNILMLNLSLYDVDPNDAPYVIDQQKKRIKA